MTDTTTTTTDTPAGAALTTRLNLLDTYELTAVRPSGIPAPLVLACPHDEAGDMDRACLENLLPPGMPRDTVKLDELFSIALRHEFTRSSADGHSLDDLVTAAAAGGAAQLRAQGRAELLGRLTALRDTWAARQQEWIYIQETADGPSANIAASRVALIGAMLDELDQAVKGGL